jgi:hypothetical protein
LSEDEFDKLRVSCAQHGARSISDFARSSVLRRLEEAPGSPALPAQLTHLDSKVTALEHRLGQLVQLISGVRGEAKEAAAGAAGDSTIRRI